jgi:hypothetical protein
VQPYSTVQFPAMMEVGILARTLLSEGSMWGAALPQASPPGMPLTMAKPRANRTAAGKLTTLPYNYDAPGALTPEQRDARLDGLVDTLLDIFLSLSPDEKAKYRAAKPKGSNA